MHTSKFPNDLNFILYDSDNLAICCYFILFHKIVSHTQNICITVCKRALLTSNILQVYFF